MTQISLRFKIHKLTFFFLISKTQKLSGINSLIKRNDEDIRKAEHILLWDLEGCTLKQAITEMKRIKKKYKINHKIYITGDKPHSFHAWSSHILYWKTYLQLLLETKYLDWGFFYWAVRLNRATLRSTPKVNREKIRLLAIIKDPSDLEDFLPKTIEVRHYETGYQKTGLHIEKKVLAR